MVGEVVSLHLRIKFSSTLQEAETDLSSSLPIISRFRAIQRLINTTTENSTRVANQLYNLTEKLSECIIFAHERRKEAASKKGFYFIRKFLFEKNMKRQVDLIEKNIKELGPQARTEKLEIQKTYPDVPNSSLITGFDAQVHEIEDLLMVSSIEDEKGHRFKAIGIVGRCGCGKTALTQKVFASSMIEETFFPRIWVCLSDILLGNQGSDMRVAVLIHILRELGNDASDLESSTISVVKLLEKLHLSLMGKRYLIVLDDAWRMEDWFVDVGCSKGQPRAESFTHGLPKGSGGAVIATGRGGRVVERMMGKEHVIRPQLSNESCRKIFFDTLQQQGEISPEKLEQSILETITRRQGDISPDKLEQINLETITKNCEGLPLAAKTLANLIPILIAEKSESKL